jgi:hypothetical protein
MDFELGKIGAELTVLAVALGILAFFFRQWIVSSIAKSAAEKGALTIKDEIIALKDETIRTLRMEMRERDADNQQRLERKDKDFMEFRRKVFSELETARRISRSMNDELKAINDGRFTDQRGNTQMLVTGLGPLEKFIDDDHDNG